MPAILFCQALAFAQPRPQLPCGREAVPSYPDLANAPIVTFWSQYRLTPDWIPPVCTGWTAGGFATLVTTVARFSSSSGTDGLLRRIGAISQLAGIRYWSTTRQRWATLIVDAYALPGPQGNGRRKDFAPDELKTGGLFYYEQVDNLAGKAIYRMHIAEVSDSRIVFDVQNVNAMRYFLLTLFPAAELQTIYFLDRDTQDVWRYYSVVRTGKDASSLTTGKQASSINRAVAFFRYFAGVPTDLEPPAAR